MDVPNALFGNEWCPLIAELTESVPIGALHASWAAAMRELRVEGEHVNGAGLWLLPEPEQWNLTEAGCRRLVAALLDRADPDFEHPDGSVPCHFLWITEDGEVIGFLGVAHRAQRLAPRARRAHRLQRSCRLDGGKDTPRGHSLSPCVRAADLGLDRVLLVCDDDNAGLGAHDRGVRRCPRRHRVTAIVATGS